MTAMTVDEREQLGQQYATGIAPALRTAIDDQSAELVAELIGELNRQELLALVVVLASEWPTKLITVPKRQRRRVVCWGCGNERRHEGHGLCRGCHVRWDDAGRPDSGPPPALSPEEAIRVAVARRRELQAERLEDFADLDSWGVGDEEAAERLGVSVWTVGEYRKALESGSQQLRFPVAAALEEAS